MKKSFILFGVTYSDLNWGYISWCYLDQNFCYYVIDKIVWTIFYIDFSYPTQLYTNMIISKEHQQYYSNNIEHLIAKRPIVINTNNLLCHYDWSMQFLPCSESHQMLLLDHQQDNPCLHGQGYMKRVQAKCSSDTQYFIAFLRSH